MGIVCSRGDNHQQNQISPVSNEHSPVLSTQCNSSTMTISPSSSVHQRDTPDWCKPPWYVAYEWKDLQPLVPLIHHSLTWVGKSSTYRRVQCKEVVSPSAFLSLHFYELLYERIPSCCAMFDNREGQNEMLESIIGMMLDLMLVSTAESFEEMVRKIRDVVEFHNAIRIQQEQYVVVGELLIEALKYCCGKEYWTESLAKAWYMLYSALLDIIVSILHKSVIPTPIFASSSSSSDPFISRATFVSPHLLNNIEE